jgi:hypothetical protein
MRQPVFGRDAPGLPISDSCVVDDGIEGTKRIDLFGHVAGLSNTREIANDDCTLREQRTALPFLAARCERAELLYALVK